MKTYTCVVVGGGYAGIHAIQAIRKAVNEGAIPGKTRLILIDKQPYHLRKVLLFQPAVEEKDITVPFEQLFPQGLERIEAQVTRIESEEKRLHYQDAEGASYELGYDILVLTVGSVVRDPGTDHGGIALTGLQAAVKIREVWQANLRQAEVETRREERKRLLTIAVAGAGISGIETAAELAWGVRADAEALGIGPEEINIMLYNALDRLFPEGPVKAGHKLERLLAAKGVTTIHQRKVLQEMDGVLSLAGGERVPVGLCVWTLGMQPNPALQDMGVPLTLEGYVPVDASYRVPGAKGLYSIGDCARIMDPETGREDGKTCKEASAQAARLGHVIGADLSGKPAPQHKPYMDIFCFGLGPQQGMIWARQWGLDLFITGKLAGRIRKMTWDIASLLK
ncbi:FAD-dependent oxidoreductase [Paenibacillus sp. KQZ6P-2]|uniref:NADH:ubiquinone reductase (non-electrogenic) n=1 Tax=Paenibacillus mangrovi TaxID=2931978 RepID=A0A9X1WVY0_9BACL|nr:FAD-dependent oxidoreductase [Paenibacillus mangrovi]MCJ8012934.1 FAD-dependent oxidoreductase [Paenibacillus mangrovi]